MTVNSEDMLDSLKRRLNPERTVTLDAPDILSWLSELADDLDANISTVKRHAKAIALAVGTEPRSYEHGYYDGLISALALFTGEDAKEIAREVAN